MDIVKDISLKFWLTLQARWIGWDGNSDTTHFQFKNYKIAPAKLCKKKKHDITYVYTKGFRF